tara:strand:- start:1322 stop:1786 length:465 start_codon:yes stop_codon:yes gene_type:complete
MKRLLLLAHLFLSSAAVAQIVPIDPATLSIPPYSYLQESLKGLAGKDVEVGRYITFLGTWENNGGANWERSAWWGRFYVDCQEGTFTVRHNKHQKVGRGWRNVRRNATALYGFDKLCPAIGELPVETRTIKELNSEFSTEFHNNSHPFTGNPIY